jgi:hypothetical protein
MTYSNLFGEAKWAPASRGTKRALIRDQETPVGQPGRMHIQCTCGTRVDMGVRDTGPAFNSMAQVACTFCGITYDGNGWVVGRPEE